MLFFDKIHLLVSPIFEEATTRMCTRSPFNFIFCSCLEKKILPPALNIWNSNVVSSSSLIVNLMSVLVAPKEVKINPNWVRLSPQFTHTNLTSNSTSIALDAHRCCSKTHHKLLHSNFPILCIAFIHLFAHLYEVMGTNELTDNITLLFPSGGALY